MRETDADSFSARLRSETAEAHREAEASPFLGALMGGELGISAWLALLTQYREIYAALEEGADRLRAAHGDRGLLAEQLRRLPSIDADLAALRERTGDVPANTLPATCAYAERIRDASGSLPRYIAHHYTRYLGDLSGGQVMRTWLDRAYGLPDAQAAFFRFEGIPKLPIFKRSYRDALDALNLSPQQEREVFQEARVAFAANQAVFTELHDAA